MKTTWPCALGVGLLALVLTSCGQREPATPEEQRARGEELLKRMSDRLAQAKAISVTTTEEIARIGRSGASRVDRLTRIAELRRPDRLHVRTTGTRNAEAFYEGNRLTLISHGDKVYGEFRTPPTIDETVDVLGERYGIALPIGDLLTDNAHRSLMSTKTTGGWTGTESVGGAMCARLEWHHPNVDWSIWVPTSGEPLPRKLHIIYKTRRGRPDARINFADWNLATPVTDATFARRVPADYEGVAVIAAHAAPRWYMVRRVAPPQRAPGAPR